MGHAGYIEPDYFEVLQAGVFAVTLKSKSAGH